MNRLRNGNKRIEISFTEVAEDKDWLINIYKFNFLRSKGLDPYKPIYVTPNFKECVYYIDGWALEDEET